MNDLLTRLSAGEVLVADGALGTLLMEGGLAPGECPESVNLARPAMLEEIAGLYLEAGAQIVQTNTFGGSPIKLALYNLEAQTEAINRAAVAAVRRAVGERAYVSGSCGPSGRLLRPYGDTEPDELYASFLRQTEALVAAGVDLICVETMTDLAEAVLAIRAAKSASGAIPVAATMTFDRTPRGFFTVMGVDIARAAAGLAEAGADIVGSNCGNGIDNMVAIARGFGECTRLPLLIQSNAGLPERAGERLVYKETPLIMAARVPELIAAGVAIIGGCCGTTPAHIRAIRAAVDLALAR
jgi:5-methyltetrahydrofolate--homocysteine methyltransferase